jgi:exodeoxyribonuclease III
VKIATWNINGVRARLDSLLHWLGEARPDVACLQEIKCVAEAFPTAEVEALGYNAAVHGQKGFNGVAILSRSPLELAATGLPGGESDEQARFIEGAVSAPGGAVRIACAYMPNGNPVGSDKYAYKLAWMARLEAWARQRLALEEALVLAGDYNVIPTPDDARHPERWLSDALFQPEARAAFRRLEALGLVDAIRAVDDRPEVYTFWDYQAGAWQKNNGIRIDHLLLSPEAADRLRTAGIDRHVRGWEKPSDHVPVWVELQT